MAFSTEAVKSKNAKKIIRIYPDISKIFTKHPMNPTFFETLNINLGI